MLPKSESGDNQISAHTVLEESKAKRDALSDDLLGASIKTGTTSLITY